jgi:hypothetical protein
LSQGELWQRIRHEKTHYPKRSFLILVVACAAIAWGAIIPESTCAADKPAAATQGTGRVIISRSQNLGGYVVGVSIDGGPEQRIYFTRTLQVSLPAGEHILTSFPIPNDRWEKRGKMRLKVESGGTYNLMVMGDGNKVVLR